MEGGGAMEGRGCDVEYWRGETHLGSSLPMSVRRFSCPRVVSHVHVSFPMSAHRCPRLHIGARVCTSVPTSARCCPCPHVGARICASLPLSPCRCPCLHVVARVCTSLPVSARCCPHLFTFVGGCFHSWAWVVAFVGGWLSSFMGNGSVVVGSRWWVVVSPRGWR